MNAQHSMFRCVYLMYHFHFRIRYPPFTDKKVRTGKMLLVPKIKEGSSYFMYILLVCVVIAVIAVVLKVSH